MKHIISAVVLIKKLKRVLNQNFQEIERILSNLFEQLQSDVKEEK